MREKREKRIKIIKPYVVLFRIVPKLRQYCSMSQNFDTSLFLVFGVSNVKYLAFGTPDGDALT